MRFLLDQSADARILPYFQRKGHDVTRIARDYPGGLPDEDVLDIAFREQRMLIASDRHFGRLVFVQGQNHAGVIFLRLGPSAPITTTTERMDVVLSQHAQELDRFIVVTEHLVRVR